MGDSSKHALGNILNCFPFEVLGSHSSPCPPGDVTVSRPRTAEARSFLVQKRHFPGCRDPSWSAEGLVNASECLPACGNGRKLKGSHPPSQDRESSSFFPVPSCAHTTDTTDSGVSFTAFILPKKGSSPPLPPPGCTL